jgi:hypothetical protein
MDKWMNGRMNERRNERMNEWMNELTNQWTNEWNEMKWMEMNGNETKWHDMKWHDMKWHEMKWHETKWHEITWNEMKWNKWHEWHQWSCWHFTSCGHVAAFLCLQLLVRSSKDAVGCCHGALVLNHLLPPTPCPQLQPLKPYQVEWPKNVTPVPHDISSRLPSWIARPAAGPHFAHVSVVPMGSA